MSHSIVRESRTTHASDETDILESRMRWPMSHLDLAGIALDAAGTNAEAFDELVETCGWEHAYDTAVDTFREHDLLMMSSLLGARCLEPTRRHGNDRRKVAIYYLSLGTGGGERITTDVAMSWRDMGYDVLLLCDEKRTHGISDLGPGITIRCLPDCFSDDPETWKERGHALHDALCEHGAEALVYSLWLGSSMGRDMLATQMAGTKFFLFNHGTSRCTSGYREPSYLRLPGLLRHADGILCLSQEDKAFFDAFNGLVTVVPNKVDPAFFRQRRPSLDGSRIAWVGRVSWDKSPVEMLDVMEEIRAEIPDATLSFIGPFQSYSPEEIAEEIKKRHLSDAVEIVGDVRHEDLPELMAGYDLAVFTSHLEGYLVALAEAKALGLPVAMYDMDYLTLLDGYKGVRVAPIGDVSGLARECVSLLQDKEMARKVGEDGREHATEIQQFDMSSVWTTLLTGSGRATTKLGNGATIASALWEAGREQRRLIDERNEIEVRRQQIEKDFHAVTDSQSFLWGRRMTFPLRKLRDSLSGLRKGLSSRMVTSEEQSGSPVTASCDMSPC